MESDKTPAELWDNVAWHFRMISYFCATSAAIGFVALLWLMYQMLNWH